LALITVALAMVVLCAWSYSTLASSRVAAARATDDAAECQRLATRMTELSARPVHAASQELATSALAKLIEQSAGEASMPADAILRITPEPARLVDGSAYREEATEIALRAITPQQVVRFLSGLTRGAPGLQPVGLRLLAPPQDNNDGRWSVEIRLVHLVYSPGSNAPGRLVSEPRSVE
jgi:hypothetical protein